MVGSEHHIELSSLLYQSRKHQKMLQCCCVDVHKAYQNMFSVAAPDLNIIRGQ